MKHFAFAVFFVLAFGVARADQAPVDAVRKMMSQSEFYMNCGLCRVERGPAASATLTIVLPPPVGVRVISANDYNWLKEAGERKAASGLYVMTERIAEACSQWSSARCLLMRTMWKQEWATGECVTPTGAIYRARASPGAVPLGFQLPPN